ncbi:hypothetical protein CPHO_08040 [Corynebacterium phocae]|uniref:Uncharacterized protein n=1 Tax=Corynebacterium phocae TaxID=161895 RepID=A0A1L7D442_9CORY|nr:hypothetical protein [Corynebacterium phocae]APT92843.1 hypothetical protein CPHO_08040 [Corynebacterium phocae]KAA8723162.1 hypothetical protein F4V58_07545 [Corynebacterium phocae]
MQIYGHPGDRVDFVSKSGAAGAIMFGDPKSLCVEFFGKPHTEQGNTITYFKGAIAIDFESEKVSAIHIRPGASSEKVDVFLGRDKLNGLSHAELAELAGDRPVEAEFAADDTPKLSRVSFTG